MTWQINEIQRLALVEGMHRHMCSSSCNRLQMEKLSKQPLKYTCFEIFPSLNTNIDLYWKEVNQKAWIWHDMTSRVLSVREITFFLIVEAFDVGITLQIFFNYIVKKKSQRRAFYNITSNYMILMRHTKMSYEQNSPKSSTYKRKQTTSTTKRNKRTSKIGTELW